MKRRAFKQTEPFPDRELLGSQFGGVAVGSIVTGTGAPPRFVASG